MMPDHSTASCQQLDHALADYLAGRLPDSEAAAIEEHASTCARCEKLLDSATQQTHTFEPPLPPAIRESMLRQVRATSLGRRRGVRAGWAVLAAAAVLMMSVGPGRSVFITDDRVPADDGSRVASGEGPASPLRAPATEPDGVVGRMGAASRLAETQAEAEFVELDAAARELEDALKVAPGDRELRDFLRTVNARRDELTRRVREATS